MNTTIDSKHHKLYNKIQLLQDIIEEINELSKQYHIDMEEDSINLFGPSTVKPLEQMADPDNIDAQLQENASHTEYQYAFSVTRLLGSKPELEESVVNIVANSGTNLAVTLKEYYLTASGIYKAIQDNMLDISMEGCCNQTFMESDREVVWSTGEINPNPYWEEIGGDSNLYYKLRDVWMEAFTKELGYEFSKIDSGTYRIYGKD